MNKKTKANQKIQAWIDAPKRHRLSDAEVQMARELGMNPTKLGSVDNHRQEPWKMPLKDFIAHLYRKQFGRERPESVLSLEKNSIATWEKRSADARPDFNDGWSSRGSSPSRSRTRRWTAHLVTMSMLLTPGT